MLNLNIELNSVELKGKAAAAFAEANVYFLENFQWADVRDSLQRVWVIAKPWLHVLAVLTVKTFVMVGFALAFVVAYGSEVAGRMLRGDDELNATIDAFIAIADSEVEEVAPAAEAVEVVEEVIEEKSISIAEAVNKAYEEVYGSVEEGGLVGIEEVVPVVPAKTKRSNRSKKTAAATVTIPVEEI